MLTTITVILVVLKLASVIDWSWWLVLLPTLIEIGVGVVFFTIFGGLAAFLSRR